MQFELPQKNNFIAIHTVFFPRENILFLREWIVYHIGLGVSHFYLYNNSGSEGDYNYSFRSENANKYGMNFCLPTQNYSDDDIDLRLNEIASAFPGFITYVLWNLLNKEKKVVYAQRESINHYHQNFSNKHVWTAFIDIDEYIFIPGNNDLPKLLQKYAERGYCDIQILQKKFADRFSFLDRYVIEITACINDLETKNWAPKHIIKNAHLNTEQLSDLSKYRNWTIHSIPLLKNSKTYFAPIHEIRFNHYNTNEGLLEWMRENSFDKTPYFLNSHDSSMGKHYDFVNYFCLAKNVCYMKEEPACPAKVNPEKRYLLFNEPIDLKKIFTRKGIRVTIYKIRGKASMMIRKLFKFFLKPDNYGIFCSNGLDETNYNS